MNPAACAICRYSVPAFKPGLPTALECRRRSPTVNAAKVDWRSQPKFAGWPRVRPEDWCGEWTPSALGEKPDDVRRAELVFELPPEPEPARSDGSLLTPREAAEHLRVTEATLAGWRSRGGGPPFIKMTSGRKGPVRYDRSDLANWLADRRVYNTAERSVAEQAWEAFSKGRLEVPRPKGR